MAKIFSPNKKYSGIVAGVRFVSGQGETDKKHLIKWFKIKGYKIEGIEDKIPPKEESPKVEKKSDKKK
jgi:hypothetical protein